MATADYKVYIDWDNDGGLYLSTFEQGLDGWEGAGTTPPAVATTNLFAYNGSQSMQIIWNSYNPFQFDVDGAGFDQGKFGVAQFANPETAFEFDAAGKGFDQGTFGFNTVSDPEFESPTVIKTLENVEVGTAYVASIWLRVPISNGTRVRLRSSDPLDPTVGSAGDYVPADGEWHESISGFTSSSGTIHLSIQAHPDDQAQGSISYVDNARMFLIGVEEVTDYVLARSDISFRNGRDLARNLADTVASEMQFELLNTDHRFSPENPDSPLFGKISPGKPVLVTATWQGREYNMFQGFLDDLVLVPGIDTRSVEMSAIDFLGRLNENKISTELFQGVRTGDAVHKVLDAVGWPTERRDIDPGATVIPWWWEEGTTGFEAIQKLRQSEGPPSIFYIDSSGVFVFRDRHHRILQDRSAYLQYILSEVGQEPAYSNPFTYDIGWRDLVNRIEVSVEQRMPVPTLEEAFSTEDTYSLVDGQSVVIQAAASDPFFKAITPVAGTDFKVLNGTVEVILSRTSGQSADITIRATGGTATVQGMRLRAILVSVKSTYKFVAEDTTSITEHGVKTFEGELPWVTLTDMAPIAQVILGKRANRLPVITYTLNNGADDRLTALLDSTLSDRVHVVNGDTFTDHDFFIETIEHTVAEAGLHHTAIFGVERDLSQPDNVFTFDDPDRGFNDGLFGYQGIDVPDNVFILDQSVLDLGLLGH